MRAAYVGLDWGTSKLQAYCFDSDGHLLANCGMPTGIGRASRQDLQEAVTTLAAQWQAPRWYASGMIGSDLGWQPAGYQSCPANLKLVSQALVKANIGGQEVYLVPGLSCRSQFGLPDVMRGEEMEVFGRLASQPATSAATLLCLPGTHTKWVRCAEARVTDFHTAMSSELYDCLARDSVLRKLLLKTTEPDELFLEGVGEAATNGRGLTRLLFSVRAKAMLEKLSPQQCSAYCRGVLIGHEIADSLTKASPGEVAVIGSPALGGLYVAALTHLGVKTTFASSQQVLTHGYTTLHSCFEDTYA